MKKKLLSLLIITALFFSIQCPANAATTTIQESNHWHTLKVITKAEAKKVQNWKKGYYKAMATGYTTTKKYHQTTIELHCTFNTGKLESQRKWGTGQVKVSTQYSKKQCAIIDLFYEFVYYHFN